MAAAVDVRRPLLPLYPRNLQDLARLPPGLGKLSQRPKVIRKSASIGASKAHFATKADLNNSSTLVENFVTRGSPKPSTSPGHIAEDTKSSVEMSQLQSRSVEEQGERDIPPTLTGNDRDGEVAVSGDGQESRSLLLLKMEAMTWAALAKDYTILSLERRLRQALEIAKAEQDSSQELGRLLRESQEREAATALELLDAKEQIGEVIEAEERLCVQLGDLEAEAVEEDRRYRSQISTLIARIETQEQLIAEVLKSSKAGQESALLQSDSVSYGQIGPDQSLADKLEKAEMEIVALRADISDANTEIRAAEGIKKRQARMLKALEKERRYLARKGPFRSVRLAPRALKKSEAGTAGGEGWKVFSVLDFQAKDTL